MSRRPDPKARNELNEAAATGRRRAQVQDQSNRQRNATLRSRRLQAELDGGGCGVQLSEVAIASLGPDVIAEQVKTAAATLGRWVELPREEWETALKRLTTLLSTGSYEPVQAALAAGVVSSLAALLQQQPQLLPSDTVRRVAGLLELLANNDPVAARAVLEAAPALVSRLCTEVSAVSAESVLPGYSAGGDGGDMLGADQLATALGAIAAWNSELQGIVINYGAAVPLLQLLLLTLGPAVEASSTAASASATSAQPLPPQQAVQPDPEEEPPAVRCCAAAMWALGMLVRERPAEILQLLSQPALLVGLRRLILAPCPYLTLLREAAWLLAFCTACGGAKAMALLVHEGGLVPGLLCSTMRCVHRAASLCADNPAEQEAAQALHQALVPLLLALTNISAEPSLALLVLTELQVARPLQQLAGAGGGEAGACGAGTSAGGPETTATGLEVVVACLQKRVDHRSVQRGAAALTAGLAWGACRAGAVAVDAVRAALLGSGVVAALLQLLLGAPMDIRKEAAAALASLCQGAGCGVAGNGFAPDCLDMLSSLGITSAGDAHGVLAAFLRLLQVEDADGVHSGLRFVTLVLSSVKRGARLVESLGGVEALGDLAEQCRAPELQAWAADLMDQHYGFDYDEADDDDESEAT